MKALILAAGYAKRLYPLTRQYPKPLLEIGGRPLIDYIVEKLEKIGEVEEILVITNSKFIAKFRQWKKRLNSPKPIVLIDDLTKTLAGRRGAIGDMHFAIFGQGLKSDLLVIGGDNLFDDSLEGFLSFAKDKKDYPVIGVFNFRQKKQARSYGVVELNARRRIIGFQEKPPRPRSALVAMCLYYFPKKRLSLIQQYLSAQRRQHDATGFYISWLKGKVPVYAYAFGGRWYDIGNPDFYKKANRSFRDEKIQVKHRI
jgi:glucose-1-phosphate thymidylyltransferase